MSDAASLLLVVNALATWCMVGLVWFVQTVHYPMLRLAQGPGFPAAAEEHARRTTRVVMPLMLVEAATAAGLLFVRPPGVTLAAAVLGAALLAAVWALTFLVQVPHHARLRRGFDEATHRALVRGNGVRTALWTARGVVVLWMVGAALAG